MQLRFDSNSYIYFSLLYRAVENDWLFLGTTLPPPPSVSVRIFEHTTTNEQRGNTLRFV